MKKTESVTYRTDTATKDILLQIAGEKKWTISQLSEEIIKEWFQKNIRSFLRIRLERPMVFSLA